MRRAAGSAAALGLHADLVVLAARGIRGAVRRFAGLELPVAAPAARADVGREAPVLDAVPVAALRALAAATAARDVAEAVLGRAEAVHAAVLRHARAVHELFAAIARRLAVSRDAALAVAADVAACAAVVRIALAVDAGVVARNF